MKKLFLIATTAMSLAFVACDNNDNFRVDWDLSKAIESGVEIDSVVLTVDGNKTASVTKLDDKHAIMRGKADKPTIGMVTIYFTARGEHNASGLELVLEPGEILINTELNYAEGTELNNAIVELFNQLDEAEEAGEDCTTPVRDFIARHNDDVSSILVLCNRSVSSLIGHAETARLLDETSDEIKEHPKMQALHEKLEHTKISQPGNMFIDFEAEYNGVTQHLSDHVGKGKYVIADFWASWCGPCRREIPGLIEVYNKYKGDDFEVIGVATWDKPEDTQKAIEELGIPYPQIMNAQRAGSDSYHIEGIPEIILFAPDGTILKRGLRGNEIGKAVSEALGR